MGYRVFLLDSVSYVELDTDNIDITTVFSVSDIKDIATRKDNITKQIAFKGTKTNNNAFGSLFHLNKSTNTALSNKLFFNYNSLRTVDALVIEDNIVVFKGNMRVLEINVTANNDVVYNTVITGKFTEFKNIIQDKMLSELNLSNLSHTYTFANIFNSWTATKGEGYLYPHIDYGHVFNLSSANSDRSRFNVLNFRPALYAKEYLKRIFSQPELTGFTFEVKGDPAFLSKFDSLVIPDNQPKLAYTLQGFNTKYSKNPTTTINHAGANLSVSRHSMHLIPLSVFQGPPSGTIGVYSFYYASFNNVFFNYRTFNSDAIAEVTFSRIKNKSNTHICEFWVELVERIEEGNDSPIDDSWATLERFAINLSPSQEVLNKTISIPIGEREWKQGRQIAIRVVGKLQGGNSSNLPEYNVTNAYFSLPKDTNSQFRLDVMVDSNDSITPKPPEGVKQIDFIKGIVNLFNMYVYTDKNNPKHVIFEQYDDFYALASPANITATALDWTGKIDWTNGYKIIENLAIPKSYHFTFKEDSDFINDDYKKKYGEVYGLFKFSDSFGVTPERKMEVIFSPTPIIQENGSLKIYPAMYGVESGNKKLQKTNIRIVFYNGLQSCEEYHITKEYFDAGSLVVSNLQTLSSYAQVSSYYLVDGQPVDDVHFGRPRKWYFNASTGHQNANTSYTNYYLSQVSELTNPNLKTIECDVYLNELDINNLDLKVPVFIDMGENGHGYFKVLSVEYISNQHTSKVVLQKIVLGTDR